MNAGERRADRAHRRQTTSPTRCATVSGALAEAVAARDAATAERAELSEQVAGLELRMQVNTQRQDEMVEQLEQAIAHVVRAAGEAVQERPTSTSTA